MIPYVAVFGKNILVLLEKPNSVTRKNNYRQNCKFHLLLNSVCFKWLWIALWTNLYFCLDLYYRWRIVALTTRCTRQPSFCTTTCQTMHALPLHLSTSGSTREPWTVPARPTVPEHGRRWVVKKTSFHTPFVFLSLRELLCFIYMQNVKINWTTYIKRLTELRIYVMNKKDKEIFMTKKKRQMCLLYTCIHCIFM